VRKDGKKSVDRNGKVRMRTATVSYGCGGYIDKAGYYHTLTKKEQSQVEIMARQRPKGEKSRTGEDDAIQE
jgi:hypothetical protein